MKLIRPNDILLNPGSASFSGKTFEKVYMASRKMEDRVYSDEQVAQLPNIEPSHIHYDEWQIRKRSASRLINYLGKKNKPLCILEVGCGNGWLSGMLAALKNSTVTGLDVNSAELNQAKRVFAERSNLHFTERDLINMEFGGKFDALIFAASIQYFSSFDEMINKTMSYLSPGGEIHILDSHFYPLKELELARHRSYLYYNSIGYGEMTEFYFHHSLNSLNKFHHKILYNPLSLKNKLLMKKDPFPWVCITRE
jgi:ubiquinone/menaquinone biosynthesis C-methylase UbiE